MDPLSSYKALSGNNMCALLKGTDLRCLNEEDCALLKKAGIDCPYVFGASNGTKGQSKSDSSSSATMPVIYGVLSVCVALAAIFVLYIIMKRKRKRKVYYPKAFCLYSCC